MARRNRTTSSGNNTPLERSIGTLNENLTRFDRSIEVLTRSIGTFQESVGTFNETDKRYTLVYFKVKMKRRGELWNTTKI